MKCPYCSGAQGRCATTTSGRWVTECCSCGRVVEERQHQDHDLFPLRAQDTPLCLVTSDLSSIVPSAPPAHDADEDPFEPTGFITAFSTWSLESSPVFARSCQSFSGHLAELERALESSSSSGSTVVVDNLRAYLQIIDVSSILDLDYDVSDHAFQLFRDCSSATCLRNRSIEALATAALVQAIRVAQEPRTLLEISIAANVPQKEIGKYIKILGEALQLSQPINSNSISVHMPRFCTLLQLNKSAQELATHIGEVVINKWFCTRRNPISISAAAIYLACQLEDKRKTQAEICKVTGLTEVTLRKVYKELLENWDDLLPPNYTPAVPPEKAFPTTAITSGRSSSTHRVDLAEIASSSEKDKQAEATNPSKPPPEALEMGHPAKGKEDARIKAEIKADSSVSDLPSASYAAGNIDRHVLNLNTFWQPQIPFGISGQRPKEGEKNQKGGRGIDMNEAQANPTEMEQKINRDPKATTSLHSPIRFSSPLASGGNSNTWSFHPPIASGPPHVQFVQPPQLVSDFSEIKGNENQNINENAEDLRDTEKR